MLAKKSIPLNFVFFIILNFLFGLNIHAQYLKSVSKDWFLDLGPNGDTCEILFYFGNAKFTEYYYVSITCGDNTNKPFSYQVKIVNDSTLSLKFASSIIKPNVNSLFGDFSIYDEKMNFRNIIGNYEIRILRRNNNVEPYIKNTIPNIITDSLINYVKLEIVGEKTHFLEPNTSFHYKIENQYGSNIFDSVEVISNELAYLYLPIKSTHLLADYYLYYINKRDVTVFPKWFRIETKAYRDFQMNIDVVPPVSKYYTQGTAPAFVCIELTETAGFNPDTFLLHLKGQIQLANTGGEALPIYFETDSIIVDTGIGRWPFNKTKVKLYFNFSLPYYLPSGNYDLILTHPQLSLVRLVQPINIHRPNFEFSRSIFPGWPFTLPFKYKPSAMDFPLMQFVFDTNSGLHFVSAYYDVFDKDTLGIKVFAFSDSTTKDGNYDLQIFIPNHYPIILNDAIRVSSKWPEILKFIPNYLINIGRADSTKVILSSRFSNLVTNKYLAPIRFLRNGIVDSSVTVKESSRYLGYKQVVLLADSNAQTGFYDAEIYDTLSQKWYLQKEAVFVMNSVSRAVDISPRTVAYSGGGKTRLYTCWFKNTHFSQAQEIRLGSQYHSVVVLNDTCIQFRGGNDQPVFYNNIDGYIGNDFLMNRVSEPTITLINPNWMSNSSRSKFTIHSDATNWTYFRDFQFNFRKKFVYENNLRTISYKVINDTMLDFVVEGGDSLNGIYDLEIIQYPSNTFERVYMVLKEAIKIVPVGVNEINKDTNIMPILSPNPNNGNFEILANGLAFQDYEITDIQGKQMFAGILNQNSIDVSPYLNQAGLYFLKLNGTKTITLKFIFNP